MLTFENVVERFSRDEVGGAAETAMAQAVSRVKMLENRMTMLVTRSSRDVEKIL
jgi:hypothetical protein